MGDAMDVEENGDGGMDMEVQHQRQHQHQQHETAILRDEAPRAGMSRRRSMSHEEERQRRASIKAILANNSITPQERRRSIQNLMDGRRSSIGTASVASSSGGATDGNSNPYGYSDTNPYGYGDAGPSGKGDANPYGYGDAGPTPRGDNGHNSHGTGYGESSPMNDGESCMPICNENTKRAEITRPPCNHYDRKCTLVSHCCGAAFGCRICHDDSPILPPLLIAKQAARRRYARSSSLPGGYTNMDPQTPEDTHHTIDRFKVREVICRECYTKQSSKTYVAATCYY